MRAFLLHHGCIHVQPDKNSQISRWDWSSQENAYKRWTNEYQPGNFCRRINDLLDCSRDVGLLPGRAGCVDEYVCLSHHNGLRCQLLWTLDDFDCTHNHHQLYECQIQQVNSRYQSLIRHGFQSERGNCAVRSLKESWRGSWKRKGKITDQIQQNVCWLAADKDHSIFLKGWSHKRYPGRWGNAMARGTPLG